MKVQFIISILLLAGCRSMEIHRHSLIKEPFKIVLGRGAQWSDEHTGYDPNLPGYHIVGDIASITLRPTTDDLPDKLVLAIRTTPTMPPMLENLTFSTPDMTLSSAPFSRTPLIEITDRNSAAPREPILKPEKDSYFNCEVVGDEVFVTLLAKAMKLLRNECKISWIDWYR